MARLAAPAAIDFPPSAARDLRRQQPDEPGAARASRPRRVARQATRAQGTYDRSNLRSRPQRPLHVAEALGPAFEVTGSARPRPLHPEAGQGGVGRERRVLPRDTRGGPGRFPRSRQEVSPGRLGQAVACGRRHVRLMVSHDAHHRGQVACWRTSSDYPGRSRLPTESGIGTGCGGSAGSRAQGEGQIGKSKPMPVKPGVTPGRAARFLPLPYR
jgi:hypothetical protein